MARTSTLVLLLFAACATPPTAPTMHAFRLLPGADLREGIQRYADEHDLQAACVASAVGSVKCCALRFADRSETTVIDGKHEILALVGTVSKHGSHLHLTVGDGDGAVRGGHLQAGSVVYTTAEVVLLESPEHVFTRAVDGSTPWAELQVGWRR